MKKINVIYWSGTGNTQLMAEAIAHGAKSNDVEVNIIEVSKASVEDVLEADGVALGCPSMGNEALEDDEMEPFVTNILQENLKGKHFALFGSYDWGDGQWMRDWEERMTENGAHLIEEGLIINNTPDHEDLERCEYLGRKLSEI